MNGIKNFFMALTPLFLYRIVNTFCIMFFITYVSPPALNEVETLLSPHHYFQLDSLFCIIMLVLFGIWLLRIQKYSPSTAFTVPKEPHLWAKIPILTLGMKGISSLWFILIALFLQSVPLIADSMESFDNTWGSIDSVPYFWLLLSVVLVGPIVEELLFRGIMFHYLEKIKTGWFPIVFSGIAFGVWHGEPVQVVYAALLGILLGIVYARVRNLKIPIILHILNNFLSTLPNGLNTDFMQNIIFYTSLLMIFPTVYLLARMVRELPKPTTESESF